MDEKLAFGLRTLASEAGMVGSTAHSPRADDVTVAASSREPGPIAPRSAGTLQTRRKAQPWPADRNFRILSIDGGGIRGLLPLSVLAAIERELLAGRSVAEYFDLISGTSTGGIIALGLAHGKTASELLELYSERGIEVFPPGNFVSKTTRRLIDLVCYKYDEVALEVLLEDAFGSSLLADARVRLCVPSFDGRYGEVFVFKTAHHPDYKIDWQWRMKAVARATSAAPTFFRPLSEGGWKLIDGGIWSNNPIMVGLVDALSCFDVARDNIEILSLGCMDDRFILTEDVEHGGEWQWRRVIFAAMSLASQNALGQAGLLIGRNRILRLDSPMPPQRIELDDFINSRRLLPDIGQRLFNENRQNIEERFLKQKADPFSSIYKPDRPPS